MNTWEIRIEGIVQGVGFRPFVYQLAHKKNIKGVVSNGVEGVRIRFNAPEKKAQEFYRELLDKKPSLAHITHNQLQKTPETIFDSFQIVESQSSGKRRLHLTPDYALCEDCRQEMWETGNRRKEYPFISCTQCGPRFSIINGLPYDRPLTSMSSFEMCGDCLAEYHDPTNRRHFSQTNSCPQCGIKLWLVHKDAPGEMQSEGLLEQVHSFWSRGEILAIKGIGGFLFACDATNEAAVLRLRKRKQRKAKPFAIMYPSFSQLEGFELSQEERDMLKGPTSPILLVKRPAEANLARGIADGLREVGIMIPYNPLFEWLLKGFGKPIVATSGNVSGSPILYTDDHLPKLLQIADGVLMHNRTIDFPQDDSVVRFSPTFKKKIILRRARGLAPSYFKGKIQLPDQNLWAAGADMKSAFAFFHEGNFYISQYLGNLSHFDTQKRFELVREVMKVVLLTKPKAILHDLHPDYFSSRLALGKDKTLPIHSFQHHKAHFAAVMAENELLQSPEPVLGVIWDGTGLGEDGQFWGSEFFLWKNKQMDRKAHLNYFRVISGDKMAREPRISALSLLPRHPELVHKFSPATFNFLSQVHVRATIHTSSMGRLFDAVAAVLDLCDIQSYEGEAAMKLEAHARDFWEKKSTFRPLQLQDCLPDASKLLTRILEMKQKGISVPEIACNFHFLLTDWVRKVANNLKTQKIAFSGGVFQNALLVDMLIEYLSGNFELFFHKQLSPNDENIAFGQLNLYLIENHHSK